MSGVFQLFTKQSRVREDVVTVLETALRMAREGKVDSVAIAIVLADRVTTTHAFSSSTCVGALIGATDNLKLSMQIMGLNKAEPNPDLSS